jgi:hypothetical protein
MMDTTNGPARERLEPGVVTKLEKAGTLVHDGRRLRSFFFDGRFLTAKDLTREQTYFLTRQADLARSGGVGVVTGLHVRGGPDPRSLSISAGHGVTPSGEVVVLPAELKNIRLDDIPEIQRLDAAFGLSPIPRETARSRSGLYIVALRPVEYTANLVASYPSSVGGARTAQDGDIIEATAITLIPYPDKHAGAGFDARRARVAHEIFARNGGLRPPVDALPIAMIALDHGVVRWIDRFLVRREVGSEQTDFLGFGQAPRALREAHLLQYQEHLEEVLKVRAQTSQGERFAASDYFFALPPAGPLPAAAVNAQSFTEVFFPPEVDVELAFVPQDELGALLAESLSLSPIDLTRTGEELSSISVLVMLPLPRETMSQTLATLFPAERTTAMKLRATASGLVAMRRPGDALKALTLRRTALAPATEAAPSLTDSVWSTLLANATTLWYARRRSFPYKAAAVGQPQQEPTTLEDSVTGALQEAGLYEEFQSLPTRATALAIGRTYELLHSLLRSESAGARSLFASAAGELLREERLGAETVAAVEQRYSYEERGQGLALLSAEATTARLGSEPALPPARAARSRAIVELDQYALQTRKEGPEALERLRSLVSQALREGRPLDDVVTELRQASQEPR